MKACPQCKERFADSADFCPHHGHRLVPIVITDKDNRGDTKTLVGTVIDGRYVVDGILGEGGMGIVFKAHHKVIDKEVAIKVLRRDLARDAAVVQRFLQEAKATSRIGHANIVDVIDFGTLPDGAAYSVMEFIDGETLSEAMRKQPRMPLGRALPIVAQMARALGAAHEKGIVHRDLKPENVFLYTKEGRPDVVKIVDFGIAKVLASHSAAGPNTPRLTRVGSVFGTPDYMAPEQAAGRTDIDERVDIYALGTILYEMVVGFVPHRASNPMSVLTMQLLDPIIPPRQAAVGLDVSDALEAVIMRALAKERDQRYRSMAELLVALDEAAGGIPVEQHGPGSGPQPRTVPSLSQGIPAAMAGGGSAPVVRGHGGLSPAHGVPALVPPTPSPVVFVEKRTGPETMGIVPRSEPPPASRWNRRLLVALGIVSVAGITAAAVRFVAGSDGEEGGSVDAAFLAGEVPADAPAAATPDAGPIGADAPPAASADAAGRRPVALPASKADAGLRAWPARTFTVTVMTDPRFGAIFHQGKELNDGATLKGLEGTETTVTCHVDKYEVGKEKIRFDGDKTVVCKMKEKGELKNPFNER